MRHSGERQLRTSAHSPVAAPAQVAAEPAPFPSKSVAWPIESFYPDWRQRLIRNLSRRSDSRWDPLTWVHSAEDFRGGVSAERLSPQRDDR
jgi:hypothetical protein